MTDTWHGEQIALSEERRAILAPKLRALLEDLEKLAEMESPDLEPAISPFAENGEHREPR